MPPSLISHSKPYGIMKIIKSTKTSRAFYFDSLYEVLNATPPEGRAEYSSEKTDFDFYGVPFSTYRDVIFADKKDRSLSQRKAQFDSEVTVLHAPHLNEGVSLATAEYGDEVWDMVSFIQGEDDCMLNMQFNTQSTPHVRLLFDISATCNIEEDQIRDRARAMLSLVTALNDAGTSVTLDVCMCTKFNARPKDGKRDVTFRNAYIVNVIDSRSAIDMRKIFYVLGCREGVRRLAFTMQDIAWKEVDSMHTSSGITESSREFYQLTRGSGDAEWTDHIDLGHLYDIVENTTLRGSKASGREIGSRLINKARDMGLIA